MNAEQEFNGNMSEITDTVQTFDNPYSQFEVHSNPVTGTIGALLASIPGCLLWLLLARVGFIAGIAGFVIIRGAFIGYEKLGKALTKSGVMICLILTCFTIFSTNCLDYAIEIYSIFGAEYDITFLDAVIALPNFIMDPEIIGHFILNLLIGYGLTAWSSHSIVRSLLSK